MSAYCFTYFGEIRGQGRPRHTKSGNTYTPPADRHYKQDLRAAFLRQCDNPQPISGAVRVLVDVYRELPPSISPKRMMTQPDTLKPDADNIAKAVLDALNGLAFVDDRQVTSLQVVKHDRVRGHASCMTVVVEGIE